PFLGSRPIRYGSGPDRYWTYPPSAQIVTADTNGGGSVEENIRTHPWRGSYCRSPRHWVGQGICERSRERLPDERRRGGRFRLAASARRGRRRRFRGRRQLAAAGREPARRQRRLYRAPLEERGRAD